MKKLANVDAVLFDLDGVVHVGDDAIAGAANTLDTLRARSIPFRFLTNTTTKSPAQLFEKMQRMRLPIEAGEIFTTHEVAAHHIRRLGDVSCWLLVDDAAREAYDGIRLSEDAPDLVVVGDIGERWTYEILNRVFNLVMDGARLIALHKGRYWQTPDGLRMDIGCFVTGLEYTTGSEATVVGKPSASFFELGLNDLGVTAARAIMVGDDIVSDVGGAQAAGIRGVLVRTGKYREDTLERSPVRPDAVIDSIASLPDLIA